MALKNTADAYGWVSKSLHWSMALLMFGMLVGGFYFDKISYSAFQLTLLSWHKSVGLLVLYLVSGRILWIVYAKKPKVLLSHAKWEYYLSKIVHFFLYGAMIGMPVSGFIMSQSGGYPVAFFGLEMPRLMDKNENLNQLSYLIHQYLAFALIAGILLHVAGGLKHHFIDRDNTLKRMMAKPYAGFIALIGMIFGGWLAITAWLLLF
ncbi:MAG: cytochrome b [Pseudomonadota bacterium]